jgi:hypothetical protein
MEKASHASHDSEQRQRRNSHAGITGVTVVVLPTTENWARSTAHVHAAGRNKTKSNASLEMPVAFMPGKMPRRASLRAATVQTQRSDYVRTRMETLTTPFVNPSHRDLAERHFIRS